MLYAEGLKRNANKPDAVEQMLNVSSMGGGILEFGN
jgi:hypothetical protein